MEERRNKTPMVKILLLIDYSSDFDRRLLTGLVEYSKEHGPWLFYRMPSHYSQLYGEEGVINWAKEWKADAIIGKWNFETADRLKELGIPVVLQNYHHRSTTFSNLTGDYQGTGKMAAQFFLRRNYRNFAFLGVKDVVWSDERFLGFHEEIIKNRGGDVYDFQMVNEVPGTRERVSQWLQKLPKPIALFCCDDAHALFVAEICKIANIAIPDQIALLGVDNDELMCNISDPPISSIVLEVEKGGYAIGHLIHQQLTHQHEGAFNIVINPTRIVLRHSTERHNIKDPYVLKVVKYIDQHYDEELSIEGLLTDIPLSRRNFEVKFKNELNTTIYQYILSCRCDRMADLLQTTDLSLIDIVSKAGFKDYNNVSRIFKKYKGCSPIEYRKKQIFDL